MCKRRLHMSLHMCSQDWQVACMILTYYAAIEYRCGLVGQRLELNNIAPD